MSNWILTSYRDWLSPVVGLLHKKLLEQQYLHFDETPVQVMDEPYRKNTTDSYMWVYCSIKDFGQPVRQFVYQPGRSGTYPQEYLKGYHGFIHTDAYKGYEKVSGITRCICWTHLRRYFVEALPKDVDSPEATIPAQAVKYINQLFEIEIKTGGSIPSRAEGTASGTGKACTGCLLVVGKRDLAESPCEF